MKSPFLRSMTVCALAAALAAAESPPAHDPGLVKPGPGGHPNRLSSGDLGQAGPVHNSALLNSPSDEKVNRLLGGLEPRKLLAGQQPPRITHNSALLTAAPGAKANRLPGLDPQKFSGDVRQPGAGHNPALLKPRPEEKINHLSPSTAASSLLEQPAPRR